MEKELNVEDEAQEIIKSIHSAFQGVSRGEITLHEAEVIDVYGTQEERASARKVDTESRWEEIPDTHIEECTSALSYLDPQSWQYYIPRHMEWSLKYFRTNNSIVSDFTIYAFDLSDDPDLIDLSMGRYRQLTDQQSRTVYCFLQYMAKNGDYADDVVAERAIGKYWGKFSSLPGIFP